MTFIFAYYKILREIVLSVKRIMDKKSSIIKDNIKFVTKTDHIQNKLLKGIIEETALLYKDKIRKYSEAEHIFKEVFDMPLLSNEYILFCNILSKNGCFDSSNINYKLGVKTVSLMDNLYSKNAFQLFCKHYSLRADYENTFISMCEAVYSERSFYAILPLFNTVDGLITSVYKLIQRYELKIVASTKVIVGNGDTETEFVLVTHNKSSFDFGERLIISVTHNYGEDIIDLMTALSSVGICPHTINTLPLSYTDDRCESLITFDISSCDSDTLYCFFKTALPHANIVGIYSIVK